MKDLLICIAFHHKPQRLRYLYKVIHNIIHTYDCSFTIMVDTNEVFSFTPLSNKEGYSAVDYAKLISHVSFYVHGNLEHPYHLTWCHRQHMLRSIGLFKNFMYIEDDMLLPYENYLNYLDNFKFLYPKGFVPSFVRIEEKDGEQYVTDATSQQALNYVHLEEKSFTTLSNPYHAFWIMPQAELLFESMSYNDFAKIGGSREQAASYPMWTLNKTPLVELDGHHISRKCFSYHLPNNYALDAGSAFGKIRVDEIFVN